ncbi:hypothetical protein E2P81_ATG04210 [Venturia nashicola]|uniref:Uncharacterized protein n=1 Tax=Venturia nashicola TaxID=86259 RepID=A0A4Z1PHX0_9PEZI|nr:hypothetical protein E6O75_ATG04311 [Venturia nashicola]TLD37398.1 hypothetical protein E2P81_ATG04210 [Venturia nashicola]
MVAGQTVVSVGLPAFIPKNPANTFISAVRPSSHSRESAPRATPEQSAPRATPEQSAPRATPEQSAPRATPAHTRVACQNRAFHVPAKHKTCICSAHPFALTRERQTVPI